jgi:adenylate kinase family enzyme
MQADIIQLYGQTNYTLPMNTMIQWSNGIGFNREEEYSAQDKGKLEQDMNAIREHFTQEMNKSYFSASPYIPAAIKPYLNVNPILNYLINMIANFLKTNRLMQEPQKWAIFTAGAPGAGKTVLLESLRNQSFFRYVYSDPDAVFLKEQMKKSYQAELQERLQGDGVNEKEVRQELYNKWRPASNFLAHYWLATFVKEKLSFYFGTTSSSPQMANTYQYFKEKGYKIEVINVYAPDDVRWASVQLRDKEFVQTTEGDIRQKGVAVHRVNDTFHKFADKIQFYYRDKPDGAAVHAATWIRDKGLTIHNQEKYSAVLALHKEKAPDVQWPFDPQGQ